jgi:hypothetical protein
MTRYVVSTLVAVAVLLGFSVVRTAEASPPLQLPDADAVIRSEDAPQIERLSGSDIADYWTEERIAGAQPYPGLLRQASKSGATTTTLLADGAARVSSGNLIGGVSDLPKNFVLPGAGTGTPNFTYPFPYDVSNGGVFAPYPYAPYSTFGPLYFTQLGTDYVCSAVSVTSGQTNNSLILTAGHCLHAGNNLPGGWSTNIAFAPGRDPNGTPLGTWSDYDVLVRPSYYATGNIREDFGFVVSDPTSNACGYLGDCAGAMGLAWNQPVFQEFWTYGYPGSPYTGVKLVVCTGPTAKLDDLADGTGALPLGMGCTMGQGSSGGPWVAGGKTAGIGYANSVVTHKYTQPNQAYAIYGPYFASNLELLWNEARAITPPAP